MENVKIASLELENVKRIKAVSLVPTESGLTIIGGNNGQGKTSVLDSIAWALGGERYKPSNAERIGSVIPPHIKITMSNGLVVERSGRNSALKVTDPTGQKAGQALLNSFVEELALNLPKFMQSSNKDKAKTLLKVIGVGDQVLELETRENQIFNNRTTVGRIADKKQKYADSLPHYDGVPEKPLSAYEIIQKQQAILAKNAQNKALRDEADKYQHALIDAHRRFYEAKKLLEEAQANAYKAAQACADLLDEPTEQLESELQHIEEINVKVRANIDKAAALDDAQKEADEYAELTNQLSLIREQKNRLLESSKLPLEGLSVDDGELTYHGVKWDCMSGSEQLMVATAIVRAINPKCGFVLLDKLEQMDSQNLANFGKWLEGQGLQVIATRVSTGSECAIYIEDGYSVEPQQKKTWQEGVF